jgi:UDP-MurNAc hydroxylase
MKATSIGHAGILVETGTRTIVCDPWFVPAFWASWFVFPRNDQLPPDVMTKLERPDYLYISHQHGDHLDEVWLANHIDKSTPVLLPDFATRELERQLNRLGFTNFVRTRNGEMTDLGDGLRVAIHVETAIADGPGGDSAMVIEDGTSRLVNQNDCRTGDLAELLKHGPVDMHWLQFSGAIWYPMVYDQPREELIALARSKVESQFARSIRYVDALGARVVVPSAGPPCFLDEDLFSVNMIDGDELSIFPDQTEFIARLARHGNNDAVMNIPGTAISVSPTEISVQHCVSDAAVQRPFVHKREYLLEYQADWATWLRDTKASWSVYNTNLVSELQAWWEPLLAMAPSLRGAIGGNCLVKTDGEDILIDFPNGKITAYNNEPIKFRMEIARPLLEGVVKQKAVDWSNSLFLSCRFTAWRDGSYNEYLYNFFKSLSVERMRRAEQEVVRKNGAPDEVSNEIELGDYVMQRYCPHRKADLSEFGVIEGDHVVCTLHGWKFQLSDGACLNADDHKLSVRKRTS